MNKQPIILALDTSTEACSTALLLPNGDIEESFQIAPKQHAELILPMIDKLMTKEGISFNHLDAIAFGQGPGSFIGLRVAACVAQGIAFATQKPVIPISSLQALAQIGHWETKASHIIAGWDARLKAVYWGAYMIQDSKIMQTIVSDCIQVPCDIVLPTGDWLAVGNAWEIYHTQITDVRFKTHCDIWNKAAYPHARALAYIAKHHFLAGKTYPPEAAQPFYVRNEVAKKS